MIQNRMSMECRSTIYWKFNTETLQKVCYRCEMPFPPSKTAYFGTGIGLGLCDGSEPDFVDVCGICLLLIGSGGGDILTYIISQLNDAQEFPKEFNEYHWTNKGAVADPE